MRTLPPLGCGCVIAAGVAAMTLAGCGSGASASHSASTGSTTTTTSTTTVTNSPAAPAPRDRAAAPGCLSDHTAVSLGGGRAGLGHDGLTLLFRNTGPAACTLTGYPGVAFVSTAGRRRRLDIARTPQGYLGGLSPSDKVNPVVRLAPGQTASALLEGEAVDRAGRPCTRYPEMLVTPPNQTVTVRFARAMSLCDPEIHPVVPGTSGSQSQ